jgi:hypothetical protein
MIDTLGAYFLHLDQTDEAAELVKKYHYSHRVPSNVQVVATAHELGGLFGDLGRAVAACYVSIPGSGHYSIAGKQVETLELTRLVRRDDLQVNLTGLISWTLRWVWRLKKGDLVVSFADKQQGHHGGIYQAASWNYDGLREPNAEGVLLDGKHFVPMRTIISHKQAKEKFVGREVTVKRDQGKHCYWKALSRSGIIKAKLIGLESHPYPRPDEPKAIPLERHLPSLVCARDDVHAREECGYRRKTGH